MVGLGMAMRMRNPVTAPNDRRLFDVGTTVNLLPGKWNFTFENATEARSMRFVIIKLDLRNKFDNLRGIQAGTD